ncbi:MAG TPA: endolytic transglycosylase MltG [Solirubrobacteraceae bacterium]|nr:endolytic transglycosylase MltG [Solirubrobacteraceae bacterium]
MSPFRRHEERRERTAEERERARAERDARRIGRPSPPVAPPPPPVAPPPQPPASQAPAESTPAVEVATDDSPAARTDPADDGAAPTPVVRPFDPAEQAVAPVKPFQQGGSGRVGRRAEPSNPNPRSEPSPTPAVAADDERPPDLRHRLHAPRTRGARVIALIALVATAVAIWFVVSLFQPLHGKGGATLPITIPRGASGHQVGTLLAQRHVISSVFFFTLRSSIDGAKLKPGTYILRRDMPYGAVISELKRGPPPQQLASITIAEGHSRRETAAKLSNTSLVGNYLTLSVSSPKLNPHRYGARGHVSSLEGFLFPATYQLPEGAPVKELVDQQLIAFRRNLRKVKLGFARRRHLTAYDVVTIASMVEREAQVPKERPLVAAVIYNRLKAHTPLGIDATIRFALNNYSRPLTRSDLARRSPYNTRLRQGLPPGPIDSPGLASLKAAAKPARVGYLYYVVKPGTCGHHAFSKTAAQFQKDAKRYNAARARKGGRSPTTCGK